MTAINDATLQRALAQFNAGAYFECHETLEALWLQETSDDRQLYQGLIQVAAAFVHWRRGRRSGMERLLSEGLAKLDRFPDGQLGLALAELRQQLLALLNRLRHDGDAGFHHLTAADLPTIQRRSAGYDAKAKA